MEIIRVNNTLITTRKTLLEKIETQVTSWLVFFIFSFIVTVTVIIMGYVSGTSRVPWVPHTMIVGIVTVSIAWWIWTMKFIMDAASNQKIIYNILGEISKEIDSIRTEMIIPPK